MADKPTLSQTPTSAESAPLPTTLEAAHTYIEQLRAEIDGLLEAAGYVHHEDQHDPSLNSDPKLYLLSLRARAEASQ